MPVQQIVCMKWGTLYSCDYVNRLYNMVARHVAPPLRFVCLTDDRTGVDPRVEILPCPTIRAPPPYDNYGWRKLNLWAERVGDLRGDVLYLDLDIVIVGNLDGFFTYGSDYVVMRNWTTPQRRIGNTSVYRFTVGAHTYLLDRFLAAPEAMIAKYRNSQTYISSEISRLSFWPDDWIRSFKEHCIRPLPLRPFVQPRLPPEAKIIVFTGNPRPHEAAAGRWPAKRWYKKLYKCIPPVRWVQEHWR